MRRIKLSLVFVAALLVVAALRYHLPAFSVAQQSPSPAPKTSSHTPAASLQTYQLYCGLWRTDSDFDSSLRIRNELLVGPLDVTPVLYMADGAEYDLSPVHLATGGVATVDVNQALASAPAHVAPHLSQFGSAALRWRYTSSGHVVGSIQMLNIPQSLIFVAPFNGVDSTHEHRQTVEGLWWRHDPDVGGFVSLANVTDQPMEVHVQAVSAGGAVAPDTSIQLSGHSTKMLDLDDLLPGLPGLENPAGGLRVQYEGPMGGVMVTGGLVNEQEGYSATMPFWFHDRDTTKAARITYASAGIMTGEPDPMMGFPRGTRFEPYVVLRNATARPLTVSPALNWMAMGGGQPVTRNLPGLTLPAHGARQIDMKAVLTAAGLRDFNGNLNLSVSFTGHAGDLVEATGSVDDTGTYVFEVEPQGVGKSNSKQAAYWTVANGFDTMYSLWNPTGEAQDLTVTFYYGDGSGSYQLPVHLAGQGSTMIDLMMLIESQQPDAKGHTIPMTVTSGSAIIQSAAGRKTPVTLAVAGGTFNVQTATCGVTCVNCCGNTGFGMVPSNFTCPVGQSMQCDVQATDCNGYTHDLSATWNSSNTAIMTVNSSTGSVTGVAPGGITLTAQVAPVSVDTGQVCTSSGGQPVCPTGTPQESTSAVVISVSVTSVSIQSDQVSVSLNAPSGNSGTLTVTWNGPSGNSDIANQNEGPGSYTFNPSLTGLVSGQYSGVTAQWTVNGAAASNTYTKNFRVLGSYTQTQYNTPAESQCPGSLATAYLTTGPTSCPWSTVNLISGFISQAWINGSGATNNYGLIQEYLAGCSAPPGGNENYFRKVSQIAPGCGSPNNSLSNTTVAVDVFSSGHPLSCGDQVLIVGLGAGAGTVKTATDSCPACNGQPHIDNYSTSSACQLSTLPNYMTIRINR